MKKRPQCVTCVASRPCDTKSLTPEASRPFRSLGLPMASVNIYSSVGQLCSIILDSSSTVKSFPSVVEAMISLSSHAHAPLSLFMSIVSFVTFPQREPPFFYTVEKITYFKSGMLSSGIFLSLKALFTTNGKD